MQLKPTLDPLFDPIQLGVLRGFAHMDAGEMAFERPEAKRQLLNSRLDTIHAVPDVSQVLEHKVGHVVGHAVKIIPGPMRVKNNQRT